MDRDLRFEDEEEVKFLNKLSKGSNKNSKNKNL